LHFAILRVLDNRSKMNQNFSTGEMAQKRITSFSYLQVPGPGLHGPPNSQRR
jgi:hypothetical protein